MKPLSIENALQRAQRFAVREWRLLVPVAFAFSALPPLLVDTLVPAQVWEVLQQSAATDNPALAARLLGWIVPLMLVVFAISATGGLAITALALQPGISVREAIALAFRRLGVLVGCLLLISAAELAVAVLVGVVVAFGHLGAGAMQALLLGVIVGLALVFGVRLVPLVPMIVSRRVGPLSALRESWIATQGAFWPILGAVVIYFVGALVVMIAASTGVGALLLLLGKALGSPELGTVLAAVFNRALAALVAAGFHLLAAAIFGQLEGARREI